MKGGGEGRDYGYPVPLTACMSLGCSDRCNNNYYFFKKTKNLAQFELHASSLK